MASSEKELEEKLLEAGNKLIDPPPSVEELLSLLDQVESFLSRVEQSPASSLRNALSPSSKALIADELLRHSDAEVKVAVASCISEITRITAPEAPYDDDQMKEVFRLIVSSFENLHDKSSRSYEKRTSILETVAKVRSCVVMLDLECDSLILDMFQHFLKEIREDHPENVFSSMETIMTLVLEESEDISLELLSLLIVSIKKDNEEVLPIAQKLGERVLESCATNLKPYLVQAVKTLGVSVEDYSSILASICQDACASLEQNDACATSEHVEDENKSAEQPLQESTQSVKEDAREAAPSQQDNPVDDGSPKLVMSNGIAQAGEDDTSADPETLKKEEDADCSDQSKAMDTSDHKVPNYLDTEKVDNSEQKQEQTTKRRRNKSSSSAKSTEPSDGQAGADEKQAEKKLDSESHSKEVPSSTHEDHFVEVVGLSENDKGINPRISSPKFGDNESEVVASPSPSESLNDENHSKKIGETKTKDGFANEVVVEDASKKVLDGTSDLEVKPAKRLVKHALVQNSLKKTPVPDSVQKGSGATSDPDSKKNSAKKLDESNKVGGGSSSRQPNEKKKGGQGKADSETAAAKEVDKEMVSSPRFGTKSTKGENSAETPKTNVKRKHTLGEKNESNTKEYGENLVGLRVEVWWPKDREFYKGVIDSFDSAKKRHKVMYDDGDEETLNLRNEEWNIIRADSDSNQEEGSDRASLDASADDMPPKKKVKTSAGGSINHGKMDASSKSGGAAASSRLKGSSTKSSHKSKDGNKSKDSKTIGKFEDEVVGKYNTPKSGSNKSATAVQKMTSKSKDANTSKTSKSKNDDKQETPKSGKSRQETLKTAVSKSKSPKHGGKSNVSGTGKGKSGLLKRKDLESGNSDVSTEEIEDAKGKSSSSSKAQRGEAKSGKKRRKS